MDSSQKISTSGTSADSWLFIVKEIEDGTENAGKSPENNIKSTEEMEDSDGISVISESEMYKNNTLSDGELEKPQIAEEIDEESSQDDAINNQNDDPNLITPPQTPNEFKEEEEEVEKLQLKVFEKFDETVSELKEFIEPPEPPKYHNKSHGVLLLVIVSLIIAVLYTNVSSLKSELARTIAIYEQRIVRLEEENQILKSQLDELILKLQGGDIMKPKDDSAMPQQQQQKYQQQKDDQPTQKPPKTKRVWLGGEQEEVVKVLDKKYNSLPDYCYFTDENDLFYEYNMENCEKKKQKLDERIKKLNNNNYNEKRDKHEKENHYEVDKDTNSENNKFGVDDIWKSNDKMYNDFMSKTANEILQSLNDEIQEIKNNRYPPTNNNEDDKKTLTKEKYKTDKQNNKNEGSAERNKKRDEKNDKKQEQRKRPQKRKDSKDSSSGDWIDQRSKAREDARTKKDNDENWYLKRKNERELHRLENFRN